MTIAPPEMLKPHERPEAKQRLQALEEIFAQCSTAWAKGEAALQEILRDELWRVDGYKSELEYLARRWKVKIKTAENKRRMLRNRAVLGDSIPDGVRDAHLVCLAGFDPVMQQEILSEAHATAPGGKITADHVEKVARKKMAEREDLIRREAEEWRRRVSSTADDDEAEQEQEEEPPSSPEPPTPSPEENGSTAGASGGPSPTDAAKDHPITREEELRRRVMQIYHTKAKWQRFAVSLNVTPEKLFALVFQMDKKDMLAKVLAGKAL